MDGRSEESSTPAESNPSWEDLGHRLDTLRPRLKRLVSLRLNPRLRRRIDSSDVLQEAFAAATQRYSELLRAPDVPFYVWIRQLTLQKVVDLHRQHLGARRRDVRREGGGRDALDATTASLARALIDGGTTPMQALVRAEREHALREGLEGLREIDREILLLRYFERLTNEECASVLGLTPTAAKVRHLRAARRLRDVLRSTGLPEDLSGP